MNQLKLWLATADTQERRDLAELAGTTVGTLSQIAGGYRTGGRASVTPRLARRIELAVTLINKRNKDLPPVFRTDLSPDCRECEFAQKCLGQKAITSGFDVIEEEA